MDIREIRLSRLAILLAAHDDNKAALARTLGKQPAQISQWFNGVRTITEDSARAIEKATKKATGWMDQPTYERVPVTPLNTGSDDRTMAAEQ